MQQDRRGWEELITIMHTQNYRQGFIKTYGSSEQSAHNYSLILKRIQILEVPFVMQVSYISYEGFDGTVTLQNGHRMDETSSHHPA